MPGLLRFLSRLWFGVYLLIRLLGLLRRAVFLADPALRRERQRGLVLAGGLYLAGTAVLWIAAPDHTHTVIGVARTVIFYWHLGLAAVGAITGDAHHDLGTYAVNGLLLHELNGALIAVTIAGMATLMIVIFIAATIVLTVYFAIQMILFGEVER